MSVIYKYKLDLKDRQDIEMPRDAIILDIQDQNDVLCLWAVVEPQFTSEVRTFFIFGTGQEIDLRNKKHIATVQNLDRFVWHVFELV